MLSREQFNTLGYPKRKSALSPDSATQSRGLCVAEDTIRGGSDKRKQSLYFPETMLQEIKDEAARLDRSLSWVVQRAWKLARLEIKKIPSVNDVADDDEAEGA